MHPIERLRFVARAADVDDRLITVEATAALMAFSRQPAALVSACRRVLSRQVTCGPLWWACARLLTASDIWATAQETIALVEGDTTDEALAYALDGLGSEPGRPHPQLGRASAMGRGAALLRGESPAAAGATSAPAAADRWLVAPVGTHLADAMWDALVDAVERDRGCEATFVDLTGFTHVVGPQGPVPVGSLGPADCPVAPELHNLRG